MIPRGRLAKAVIIQGFNGPNRSININSSSAAPAWICSLILIDAHIGSNVAGR